MGNKVTKVATNGINATASSIRRRRSGRRRNSEDDEYPPEIIRLKYENMPTLTVEEKKILKSSWKIIQTKIQKCGTDTFLSMFETHPDAKAVFRQFQGIDLVALEQSMEIKEHGERVMKIVQKVIHNLDNYQKVWDLLISYGKLHFGYGALPMYFDMMGPHFVIAIRSCLGNEWYEALEYHWLALFNLIVYCMKFGWNLKRAEEQKRARYLQRKRNGAK